MSAPRSVSWFDGYRFAPPILQATDGVTGGFEKAQQGRADYAFGSNPPYKIRILTAPSADDDFTDLDHRAQIGIVRNVAHDLLGMRAKPGLEGLDRVAEDVTHSDIGRGRAGAPPAMPLSTV